jgi:hypothetical protein
LSWLGVAFPVHGAVAPPGARTEATAGVLVLCSGVRSCCDGRGWRGGSKHSSYAYRKKAVQEKAAGQHFSSTLSVRGTRFHSYQARFGTSGSPNSTARKQNGTAHVSGHSPKTVAPSSMAAHKAGERDEAKPSQLALQRNMKRRDFAAGRQELVRPLTGRRGFPLWSQPALLRRTDHPLS